MEGILLILVVMMAERSRLVADLGCSRRNRLADQVGLAEEVVAGLAALSELIQWSRKPLTHHPTCP